MFLLSSPRTLQMRIIWYYTHELLFIWNLSSNRQLSPTLPTSFFFFFFWPGIGIGGKGWPSNTTVMNSGPPKIRQHPNPSETLNVALFGQRVFADIKILKWDHPRFRVSARFKGSYHKEKVKGRYETQTQGGRHCEAQAETGVIHVQAKKHQELPTTTKIWEGHRTDSPSESLERTNTTNKLISDF